MDSLVATSKALVRRPLPAVVVLSLAALALFRFFSVRLRRWLTPSHRHSRRHSKSRHGSSRKEIRKSLPNIVLLLGIPGSGKSTWAEQYVRRCDRSYIIIDANSIRTKIPNDPNETSHEEKVRAAIMDEVTRHVGEKHNVILDDHYHPLDSGFRKQIISAVPSCNHLIVEFPIKPLFARVRLEKDIEAGKRIGSPTDVELEKMDADFNAAQAQVKEEGWMQLIDTSQHTHRSRRS